MTKIDLLHGDCLELMKDIPDKSITNNDFVNNSYWVRYIEGDRRFE